MKEKDINTAGRKPKDGEIRETKITIKVTEKEAERIKKMAEFVELPKTVMTRNLVLSELDTMETLHKTGVLHIAKGIVKTSEWLKARKRVQTSMDF